MAKKKNDTDEVTLPGSEEQPEEESKSLEEAPPENIQPPEEDVQEIPDDEPGPPAEEPVSEEIPHEREETAVKLDYVPQEKLKIIQSRDVGEVETKYSAWYSEFVQESRGTRSGHIVERHIVEGGNGLIILCIFYTVFEPAE